MAHTDEKCQRHLKATRGITWIVLLYVYVFVFVFFGGQKADAIEELT